MKKSTSVIAKVTAAVVLGLGLGLSPVMVQAHTPEVTDTCDSISAYLTNYEYIPGSPAEYKTEIVTPYKAGTPEVPGKDAVPATFAPKLFEFVHKNPNHPNSPRWEAEGWNADGNENSKGWSSTGNVKGGEQLTPEIPAVAPIPAVPEQPEVTAQVETKPAVPEQDNTITLILDGATVAGPIHFGNSYSGTMPIDGTKDHTYSVVIDAIGTHYDKTITGTTEACPVKEEPPVEEPPVEEPPVVVPPVVEPPVVVPPVVQPPVVTPPAVMLAPQPKPVVITESDEILAETGGDVSPLLLAGGVILVGLGVGTAMLARRKN